MLLLPALAIFQTSASVPKLSTYTFAGQSIQAEVPPPENIPAGEDIEFGGWTYRIPPHADPLQFDVWRYKVQRTSPDQNEWGNLAASWNARSSEPVAEWRARFVLFPYTNILDKNKNGVLRIRPSAFYGGDSHVILQAIALLGSMIESESGGKLKFVPEVSFDEDTFRFDVPAEMPYSAAFADHYLRPRVNGGYFEADDGIYRGPYSSIFLIDSGPDDDACFTAVNGMPVSGIPFFFRDDFNHPGELAVRLFNEWYKQLVFDLARHGYQFSQHLAASSASIAEFPTRARLPLGLMSDAMWAIAANARDTIDYPEHYPSRSASALAWSKAGPNPFTTLPKLDISTFAEGLQTSVGSEHSISVIPSADHDIVLAEPEVADFVASRANDPLCLGFLSGENGPKFAFRFPPGPNPLNLPERPSQDPQQIDFKSSSLPPIYGFFSEKLIDDPLAGKVLQLQSTWISRAGGMELFRFHAPSSFHFLDLRFKPGTGVFTVRVHGSGGTRLYDLGTSPPIPSESRIASASLPLNGADWQDAQVPLDGVGELQQITLGQGNAAYFPVDISETDSVLISSAKLELSGSAAPPAATGDPDPTDLLLAAKATPDQAPALIKLLDDPNQNVELNAAAAFTRIKDPAAIPALLKVARNIEPRLAQYGLQALMFQGTKDSVQDVADCLMKGPFEADRYYAALLLAPLKNEALAEAYSLLITSKNWQTRLAGVQAIAQMPGDSAQKYLLGLLEETDPEIEATIAQSGSSAWEDFDKRMEWYGVNDASDWMRASSDIALIHSVLPGYPEQGLKGLKDDSWAVKVMILKYLGAHPDPKARAAILECLDDKAPEVRQSAILALRSYSATNLTELAHVKLDKDERVQTALVVLAGLEHITLPSDTMRMLLASPDESVVDMAKNLQP